MTTHLRGGILTFIICLLCLPNTLFAQVINGHVQNEITWEPIPFAVIILNDANRERVAHTSSDEDGFYEITAPSPGDYFVQVMRIGYLNFEGGPLTIAENDTLRARLLMQEEDLIMDELTVMAERYNEMLIDDYLDNVRFTARKRASVGRFITRDDLKDQHVIRASDLFLNVQGVTLVDGVLYSTRYSCPLKIVLNGFEIASSTTTTIQEFGVVPPEFNIDSMVNPDHIVGIEVYSGLIGQPAQFGTKSRCGLIAIWTR